MSVKDDTTRALFDAYQCLSCCTILPIVKGCRAAPRRAPFLSFFLIIPSNSPFSLCPIDKKCGEMPLLWKDGKKNGETNDYHGSMRSNDFARPARWLCWVRERWEREEGKVMGFASMISDML